MSRPHRYFIPGYIWHLTHRCHDKSYLLNHHETRERYRYWLYEAVQRYKLRVLNFSITCNHIHLLVYSDTSSNIPRSMQLAAGRTAQEYNKRTDRHGAFWEDRYHATAVEESNHLMECITYIDLNMVRTGAVDDPAEWQHCGLYESLQPRARYKVLNEKILLQITGCTSMTELNTLRLQRAHKKITDNTNCHESKWSQRIGIGDDAFLKTLHAGLLSIALDSNGQNSEGIFEIREEQVPLEPVNPGDFGTLTAKNTLLWDVTD